MLTAERVIVIVNISKNIPILLLILLGNDKTLYYITVHVSRTHGYYILRAFVLRRYVMCVRRKYEKLSQT